MNKAQSVKSKAKNYKKILIVRLDRIGDVLLSTPVIKALRDRYPESHIAFMVRPYAREVVEGNPCLNEVIVYDKDGCHRGFFGTAIFINELRRKKFDLAIVLHPTLRSHIITFFSGIPERIGYDRKGGWLLSKRLPHTKQFGLKHERDYALDMVKYLGIKPKDKDLCMPLNKESEKRMGEVFNINGIKSSDIVVALNPGASCPSKRWSPERFAALGDSLIRDYGARVIIVSGQTDRALGNKVASAMKERAINLAGDTTVSDVASILRRSNLFISNDSGPVHIACAVGIPVIAIFGRRDRGLSPERWGPTGERDIIFHKDMGCDPCLAHKCQKGFKCLEAITVEEVIAGAGKILKR